MFSLNSKTSSQTHLMTTRTLRISYHSPQKISRLKANNRRQGSQKITLLSNTLRKHWWEGPFS